jgi:hypothetical protein
VLHLLFQSLEQVLGRTFSHVAALLYATSLVGLAVAISLPVYRLWRDQRAARAGLSQRWVMTCRQCNRLTFINAGHCDYCEADLGLPRGLKRLATTQARSQSSVVRRLRWAARAIGSMTFIGLSVWLLATLGALTPEGPMQQLLIGLSLLSWIAFGRLVARIFRVEDGSVAGRFTDGVLVLATVGALSVSTFLADAARSEHGTALLHMTAGEQTIAIDRHFLAVPDGEVRFEYLQLDHELLGYHRVIPVAVAGAERIVLTQQPLSRWVVERLERYADGRARRGLVVRRRTEHLRLSPGEAYDVIQRRGQVLIRRLSQT